MVKIVWNELLIEYHSFVEEFGYNQIEFATTVSKSETVDSQYDFPLKND